jgi:hypothetical protein
LFLDFKLIPKSKTQQDPGLNDAKIDQPERVARIFKLREVPIRPLIERLRADYLIKKSMAKSTL